MCCSNFLEEQKSASTFFLFFRVAQPVTAVLPPRTASVIKRRVNVSAKPVPQARNVIDVKPDSGI